MNDAFLNREFKQLLPRIRPGTGHTAGLVKATSRAFEWADALKQRRRELSHDTTMTAEQRKQELSRIVSEEMLPDLAGLVEPARRAKGFVAAERKKLRPGVNLDAGTAALYNDAAVVDAALYFVKRELGGLDGVSPFDIDMLTTPEAAR